MSTRNLDSKTAKTGRTHAPVPLSGAPFIYGEEDEVFYCASVAGTGFTGAVLHFAFPYLEKHRLVVQDLIA